MEENLDKIKDLFSSKLKSFEPEVPASIWGELDQILSEATPIIATPILKKTTPRVRLLKFAGIAACIVAIVAVAATIGILPSHDVEIDRAEPLFANIIIPEKKEPEVITKKHIVRRKYVPPSKEIEIAVEEEISMPTITKIVKKRESLYARSRVDDIYYLDENGLAVKEQVTTKRRAKGGLYTRSDEEIAVRKDANSKDNAKIESQTQNASSSRSNSPERFSIGIVSNLGLMSDKVNQKGVMLFSSDLFKEAHPEVYKALKDADGNYELKHDIPISVGLTFSKTITPRLSIATGLTYTYLSSTINSVNTYVIDEKQTFNYLGIPLSLDYTFANAGDAQFYASLGILAQKDIHGSYRSTFREALYTGEVRITESSEAYTMKKSIHQNKIQLSGHLTLGAAYPLYRRLYLYGTVGGAYYFDANNKYRTIYSDHKLQLDLNVGLRLGF